MTVLISADDLAARLATGSGIRLLDVRWSLAAPDGRDAFAAGHIAGAVYVDLDTELAAPAAPGQGRHPLPEPQALQDAARRWGLREGETVVAYDDVNGLSAARAWWLLRWAGVGEVLILDGGLAAWRRAGHPLEQGTVQAEPGDVVLTSGALASLDPDGVARFVGTGGLLLDARAAERYRGEPNPIDPKLGHVPGAVSAPTADNLADDGTFRPAADLAARFAALGVTADTPVGVYCGSGVTAAHEIAALAVAGVENVVLYPGSWSQWATLENRPVAVGEQPGRVAPLITPHEGAARVAAGAVLIDVRSPGGREKSGVVVPGAHLADRARIAETLAPEAIAPDANGGVAPVPGLTSSDTEIVVICGSIVGSGPIAAQLLDLGYRTVSHIDGGVAGWVEAGLPSTPLPALSPAG